MARKRCKKLPSSGKTIRKVIPVSLITIKDKYKKHLERNIKEKYKLTDKVVFEIIMKVIKDIPEKEFTKKVPKKYLKNT